MEANVAYDNFGACFNGTRSANVVFRNNTCWHNGRKKRPDTDAEVTTFGSIALHNNILVPTPMGACKCAQDGDCGGPHGHCQSTGGIGAFCRTGARSRCTQDAECPDVPAAAGVPGGKLCLPVQGLELVTAASDEKNRWPYTFFAGQHRDRGESPLHHHPGGEPGAHQPRPRRPVAALHGRRASRPAPPSSNAPAGAVPASPACRTPIARVAPAPGAR